MPVPPKPGGSGHSSHLLLRQVFFLSLVQGLTLKYFQNSPKPSLQDSFFERQPFLWCIFQSPPTHFSFLSWLPESVCSDREDYGICIMWRETCGPTLPLENANTCPAAHVRELAGMIRRAPAITLVLSWPKLLGMKCPISFPRVHQREGELSFSCVHVFGLWMHHSRWKSAALCHRYIKSVVMMERNSLRLHREARKLPLPIIPGGARFSTRSTKKTFNGATQDCFWPGNPSRRKRKPTSIPLAQTYAFVSCLRL